MTGLENARALFMRERLNLARMVASAADPPRDEPLSAWLASVPVPPDLTDVETVLFRVSATCTLRRLTWWADGEPGLFLPAMADYFERVEASAAELDRLSEIGPRLQPERLGYWVTVGEGLFDAGWYFPADIPVAEACDFAPAGQANDSVRAWAAAENITACASLGRSIGQGNPFTALQMALPAGTAQQQVEAALRLFDRLRVPDPPELALGAILNIERPELAVSVWLLNEGVAKVGLLAPDPSIPLMLDICQADPGFRHADALATFSGVLGADRPVWVECEDTPAGVEVELHYTPSSTVEDG